MKIMVLQARYNDDPMLEHERACFVGASGLDRVARPPSGVRNLVRSELCAFQALKVEGAQIWATQFHPELDQAANLHRYRAYIERYDPTGNEDGFRSLPSPETSRLLPLFLELVS